MLRSTKMLTVLTTAALGVGLYFTPPVPVASVAAAADSYTPLCFAASEACEYTGPNAPVLRADVCWDGETAVLKNGADCAAGSRPFSVSYGEVSDPLTLEVIAYQPLPNACDLGYCMGDAPGSSSGILSSGHLCCDPEGNCVVLSGDFCSVGDLVYCFDYSTNEDDEVTCHDDFE